MESSFSLVIILSVVIGIIFYFLRSWKREKHYLASAAFLQQRRDEVDHQFVFSADNMCQTSDVVVEHVEEESNQPLEEPVIEEVASENKVSTPSLEDDLIVINVFAKNSDPFVSYDLLQAISATGMRYGEMNIFHFFEDTPAGMVTLFSLASATKPGDFDLTAMGDFSCVGLTLFMSISRVPEPMDVFNLMLETAEQLAEDLGGDLRKGPHVPWSDDIMHMYQQRIMGQQARL